MNRQYMENAIVVANLAERVRGYLEAVLNRRTDDEQFEALVKQYETLVEMGLAEPLEIEDE